MPYPSYNGYNPYQQFQMPTQNYFNQMPQLQQMPQSNISIQNNNSLSGKIVDSIEVVKVTDVPMDGNFYYFPKADGTEIYTKRWLANGTTEILNFTKSDIVDSEMQIANENKVSFEDIVERLNTIDEKIERMLAPQNNLRNQNKKEA